MQLAWFWMLLVSLGSGRLFIYLFFGILSSLSYSVISSVRNCSLIESNCSPNIALLSVHIEPYLFYRTIKEKDEYLPNT